MKIVAISVVAVLATLAQGFVVTPSGRASSTALFSTVPKASNVNIIISGTNIELTDALQDYVEKKLERPFGKLQGHGVIQNCEVHLSVNKNPRVKNGHKVEVTTSLKGTTIRTSEESPDMYASIDMVTDRISRKLRKYKERRLEGWHGGKSNEADDITDALTRALEETEPSEVAEKAVEDAEEDPYSKVEITKIKSFNLGKPQSLQEAIFALDYIDHDFYVFKNDESNEINVVYKRNAGGVGLIQPSDEDKA